MNVLAGNALLWNASISDSEPTEYFAQQSPMEQTIIQNDYDGDGDGLIDSTIRGDLNDQGMFITNQDADRYGVFLTN